MKWLWYKLVFAANHPWCVIFGHEPIMAVFGNYSTLTCMNCDSFLTWKDHRLCYSPQPVSSGLFRMKYGRIK